MEKKKLNFKLLSIDAKQDLVKITKIKLVLL